LHRRQLFVVMELCSGGDLYQRDPYTEVEAARIIGNILSAIAFMHSKNVTHRDLKVRKCHLENVLHTSWVYRRHGASMFFPFLTF
jgi:serine/threonine protein kinase